jgi:hypothetical protein
MMVIPQASVRDSTIKSKCTKRQEVKQKSCLTDIL